LKIGALLAYERPLPTSTQFDQVLFGSVIEAKDLEKPSIAQYSKWLHLSSIGTRFASLAEKARQQNQSHLRYLEALLSAEVVQR
jgi:hypothetical protein